MKVNLIQVPYMCGYEGQGASHGPLRFVEEGADKLLVGQGHEVSVERMSGGSLFWIV